MWKAEDGESSSSLLNGIIIKLKLSQTRSQIETTDEHQERMGLLLAACVRWVVEASSLLVRKTCLTRCASFHDCAQNGYVIFIFRAI